MPIVAADWSITRSTKIINYIGDDHLRFGGTTPSYATVIEFHRWIQSLADDAEYAGDDEMDIININPTSRSTDNIITLTGGYTITANAAEHLYDGSIIQGNTGVDKIIWDGIVNFGNASVTIQVIQTGVVVTDDWWNLSGGGGLNADSANGISHRMMIKVHDFVADGGDIDGRRLNGISRTFGNTYAEFGINGTSRGNNVLALSDASDLNNSTAAGTVSGWTTITNTTEGYVLLDVNNDTVNEEYYSQWNKDTYTINQFYERMKWLTRDGSASTIYGLNGLLFRGITHEIVIDTNTGTFSAFEAVSWTGGTGQMFAIDSTTAGTKMWIQLLTGIAPTDGQVITGATSSATAAVNVTVTDRSALISTPFVGASTGSAIIGSYGLGIETADLSASDKLFDLTNTQITPPNNVTFTVSGLVVGEDRVLVAPWDGSTNDADGNPQVDFPQMSLSIALNGAAETAVVLTAAIPSDTPSSGTLRVQTDSGFYQLCVFTSWTGSTFTIDAEDFSGDPASVTGSPSQDNVFISYIDVLATATSESFTGVYDVNRSLVIKVRDGAASPIKEFISSGTLGSNGGSVTAIRTVDS